MHIAKSFGLPIIFHEKLFIRGSINSQSQNPLPYNAVLWYVRCTAYEQKDALAKVADWQHLSDVSVTAAVENWILNHVPSSLNWNELMSWQQIKNYSIFKNQTLYISSIILKSCLCWVKYSLETEQRVAVQTRRNRKPFMLIRNRGIGPE